MAIALVTSAKSDRTTSTGVTTPAVDTTGANLLVVAGCCVSSAPTVTDSKSNTWTAVHATVVCDYGSQFRAWYCIGGTVGTSHTFDIDGTTAPGCVAIAFSGVDSLDQVATNTAYASDVTTFEIGNITPTAANSVLIAIHAGFYNTIGINESYTNEQEVIYNDGVSLHVSVSYKIQGAAAQTTPDCNLNAFGATAGSVFNFKEAGATELPRRTIINQAVQRAAVH